MRITPVSMAGRQNLTPQNSSNVSFGKFADENAAIEVKKAIQNAPGQSGNYYYSLIEKAPYFIAYTDKKDGKIKGEFTQEFSNSDSVKKMARRFKLIKESAELQDLTKGKNAYSIALDLESINDVAAGVDIAAKLRSEGNSDFEERQAIERQARIDNLAD